MHDKLTGDVNVCAYLDATRAELVMLIQFVEYMNKYVMRSTQILNTNWAGVHIIILIY